MRASAMRQPVPRTPIPGRIVGAILAAMLATCLPGSGAIIRVPTLEEGAKSSRSEVQNRYRAAPT